MKTRQLEFKQQGDKYITEFEVPSDFNVHLEREEAKKYEDNLLIFNQKTAGTLFANTENFDKANAVFDYDFTGFVFPKTIQVISYTKVLNGYVSIN